MSENQLKDTFTVNVAYTTPSGRMHIGHGLGHTVSDVSLRYESLRRGRKTFLGFGMHSTGKDLINILTKLKDEENLSKNLKRYNISPGKRNEILALDELPDQVEALVQEYRAQYEKVIEKMGISMDFDSFFSTNQEANQRFTQWTLKKLYDAGLIIETESDRPYCQKCDDIKHIDKDLSEVTAIGDVDWDKVGVYDGMILGGEFECRLHGGEKIFVKNRKEWAIDYANLEMQQRTIELMKGMNVFPKKYADDLENIIKTRKAKPFERKAEEAVGAISPYHPDKRVEALADSNIYMEFYAISQSLNQGKLEIQNLTDEFFDYILLDKGDPDKVSESSRVEISVLNDVKILSDSIYPVNISVIGHEHIGVHLPFSLFTHAAVLPDRFFFGEYIITSHITKEGEKMSKSKGNVVYLDELLDMTIKEGKLENLSESASLDTVRFFLSYYQNLDKDFDWSDVNFRNSGMKGINKYVRTISRASELNEMDDKSTLDSLDKWFSTVDQKTITDITEKFDNRESRWALISLVDVRGKALSSYMNSENPDRNLLSRFILNQINMGYPVMPRITDELRGEYYPGSQLDWPKPDQTLEYPEDFEIIEHQFKGKNYVNYLVGAVNEALGKMLGTKEIRPGDSAVIITPTKYQRQILEIQKIPLTSRFVISFSIDPDIDTISVRKSDEII